MQATKLVILTVLSGLILTGCTRDPYTGEQSLSNTAIGAGLGAALGTGIGAIAGGGRGAAIGAASGAVVGGAGGYVADRQDASVNRTKELTGYRFDLNRRVISGPAIEFYNGGASLPPGEMNKINTVVDIINQNLCDGGYVRVIGHASPGGSSKTNMELSLARAKVVANLIHQKKKPRCNVGIDSIGVGDIYHTVGERRRVTIE